MLVVIDDKLDKAMREILPARKGALSDFINKAIAEKLERMGVKVR